MLNLLPHPLALPVFAFKSSTVGRALRQFIVLAARSERLLLKNNSVESTAALTNIFQLMHLPGQGYLIPLRATHTHAHTHTHTHTDMQLPPRRTHKRAHAWMQALADKMATEDLCLTNRERERGLDNVHIIGEDKERERKELGRKS